MITYSGASVWPNNDGIPTLYDIGVGLGRQPRFGGQTAEWYPVLCHVLTCARLLPGHLAIHGLMHDAPEAVTSDVVTPWKTAAAVKREHMLLKRIYRKMSLPWPTEEEWVQVYEIDRQALIAEAYALGHAAAGEIWPSPDPLVMNMTLGHLEMCRSMIDAHVSGPIFQEAYHTYRRLAPILEGSKGG